jgi:hypothetical protein
MHSLCTIVVMSSMSVYKVTTRLKPIYVSSVTQFVLHSQPPVNCILTVQTEPLESAFMLYFRHFILGGSEIFCTRPYWPCGPPSILYNVYLVFPGVKRPGLGVDHPPHLALRLKKEQRYNSTPPLGRRGLIWGKIYLSV